ncbi:lysophospholipid acyltransferase family protein [Capillimicrobium parvum]|uniref:Bifunctional protein Aas n=1 Tax=Capillimicrobium parvum TaxID=2884022 RepID=A0A9E7C341_9ACTN|nr:lysophospholipid acyltransferase family protein [Capillimicrobium parvum]UGS38158.1 Bifunctional protein Aas [Capillimicrobium parvum]
MTDEKLSGLKEQVYRDPRPKEYFDRFHERARTREPDYVYELVRTLTTIWGYTAFRARAIGADNVPASGSVIIAPNHFSFMDHFLCGMFVRRRIRFMAKSQLFTPPMQWIYTHGGVFPVRRGARDEDAFLTAEGILENGGCIAMYPEAGRSRTGKLADQAKPGIGRLALTSGAPVVPVAIFGSHRVRNWKKLQFPKVTVQYGEPVAFPVEADPSRERQQEVADEIFARIKELHAGLEQHGRRGIAQRVRDQQRALRRSKRGSAAPA